jgi:hypothetical protein
MFSLEIVDDFVTLIYENDKIRLTFMSEEADCLEGNSFDSTPSNGNFNFTQFNKKIWFTCAKYGDGRGGSLDTIIKNMTKEEEDSLNKALLEWRTYLENRVIEDDE